MIIVSSVLTALTLGIGGAVGIPSALSVRTDILRTTKDQAALDDRFAMHKIMNKTVTEIAQAEKRVVPLSDMAVLDGHELDFVTALESAAKDTGVVEKPPEITTVNQTILSPWEREVPIKIAAEGTFKNVLQFLNAVERMPYLVNVNNIQLIPLTSGENGGSVIGNFSATVYWLGAAAPDFVHGQTGAISGTPAPVQTKQP